MLSISSLDGATPTDLKPAESSRRFHYERPLPTSDNNMFLLPNGNILIFDSHHCDDQYHQFSSPGSLHSRTTRMNSPASPAHASSSAVTIPYFASQRR